MISSKEIEAGNSQHQKSHERDFTHLSAQLSDKGINTDDIVANLSAFQVAITSWALGTGGTRFGRFPGGGKPGSLEEKIKDVDILQ